MGLIESKDSCRLDLPPDTLSLLSTCSFSGENPLRVSFCQPRASLQTLKEWCNDNQIRPQNTAWNTFYRIGTDEGTQLCLARGTGHVVSIDPMGQYVFRFVNSSLSQFMDFLKLFRTYADGVCAMTDVAILEHAHEMARHMMRVDPIALTTRNSWWGSVIEQIEEELS